MIACIALYSLDARSALIVRHPKQPMESSISKSSSRLEIWMKTRMKDQGMMSQTHSVKGSYGDFLIKQSRLSRILNKLCKFAFSLAYQRVNLTTCRKDEDLTKLSSLGHFLKGSSAALGIIKVQDACEKIQHYGNKRDEESGEDLSPEGALKLISEQFLICIKEYRLGKGYLQALYEDDGEGADDE
jgi:hypothetical protein